MVLIKDPGCAGLLPGMDLALRWLWDTLQAAAGGGGRQRSHHRRSTWDKNLSGINVNLEQEWAHIEENNPELEKRAALTNKCLFLKAGWSGGSPPWWLEGRGAGGSSA